MANPGSPPDSEISVDESLVRRLLAAQHPDLAELPLRLDTEGWDNVNFRLGESLAVRLPRRQIAASLIQHEQRWLPVLAPHLPLPIPVPVRVGRPGGPYPWDWSVVPWFAGTPALQESLQPDQAAALGTFLASLHGVGLPPHPPQNQYRGGRLTDRGDVFAARLPRLVEADARIDSEHLAATWEDASTAPIDMSPAWLHGDLHSKNVLATAGHITAIIDWGDICSGDVATDLGAVWMLFEGHAHDVFWDAYGPVSAATTRRAMGWAITFGAMLWDSHRIADPAFAEAGLTAIRRTLAA